MTYLLSIVMITTTKNMLNSRFDIKYLGLADVKSCGPILSQSHYIDNIIRKFDKDNFGIARTSIDVTLHISKNKVVSISQVEYFEVIDSLMHLMSCTRPDKSYAINKLSRYMSNLGAKH